MPGAGAVHHIKSRHSALRNNSIVSDLQIAHSGTLWCLVTVFLSFALVSFPVVERPFNWKWCRLNGDQTMTALLIGYAVAIAIVFFASWVSSINRPRHKA
jgi:hypothetical protein